MMSHHVLLYSYATSAHDHVSQIRRVTRPTSLPQGSERQRTWYLVSQSTKEQPIVEFVGSAPSSPDCRPALPSAAANRIARWLTAATLWRSARARLRGPRKTTPRPRFIGWARRLSHSSCAVGRLKNSYLGACNTTRQHLVDAHECTNLDFSSAGLGDVAGSQAAWDL